MGFRTQLTAFQTPRHDEPAPGRSKDQDSQSAGFITAFYGDGMNSAPWDDPRIKRGMAIQLQRRRERLDAGEKAVGWKVAFGAPAAMERLRITAPLFGFLMQRG